jgi:hypothetical protein
MIDSYNVRRREVKGAIALRGILLGVSADGVLRTGEALFLDAWLRAAGAWSLSGDLLDAYDVMQNFLSNRTLSREEIDDVMCSLKDIIEYGCIPEGDDRVNEFLGILAGISSDSFIQDSEIAVVKTWIAKNKDLCETWPIAPVTDLLEAVLLDGFVDEKERDDLLKLFKNISGSRFLDDGVGDIISSDYYLDSPELLDEFPKTVCFSGKSVTMPRKDLAALARGRGYTVQNNVTKNLGLLIVGVCGEKNWRFITHGRKIEKALKYKKEGQPLAIISEREWEQLY